MNKTVKIDKNFKNPINGKAVQLISQTNGRLVLNNRCAELIKSIKGNVGIISIIGPYRSGKSYIMNRLLNRSEGFKLGCEFNSETKGIWMWDTILESTDKSGNLINLIILDTEV